MSQKDNFCEREEPSTDTQSWGWFTSCQKMLQYSFNLGFFFFFLPLKRAYLGISLEYTLDTVGVTTNKWQRCFSEFPHSQTLRNFSLTCTGTHCKAHSPLGSVKDDIKSFHDCSTNDQSVCGGGDAESVALQIISYHKDGLNIKLLKRKKNLKMKARVQKATPHSRWDWKV